VIRPNTLLRTAVGTARDHRQRHAGGRAGQGNADEDARAEHDANNAVRVGQQQKAAQIKRSTREHDRTKAQPHCQCASNRLKEAPGQILYGQGKGEVGYRNRDILRQRLHDETKALAQTHAQAQHHGRAKQDWHYRA